MFESKEQFKEKYERRMTERFGRDIHESSPTEQYLILGEVIRDSVGADWRNTKKVLAGKKEKQVYYFSMEFLLGRLMTNNLMNLGIYDLVKEGLADYGIDLNRLEDLETDAGLGNGGLGRLAACFLDSLASNNYGGHGNSIRYEYGLFKQQIRYGRQVETPDQWLKLGYIWEVRKPEHAVDVAFYGQIDQEYADGRFIMNHKNAEHVRAVPYDVPVIGKDNHIVNTLRLWKPEASDILPKHKDFITYITEVNEICQNVYPDDSTEHGRYLRIKQEYFFASAGIQTIIKSHIKEYGTLDNLPEKIVIQLNDTHPVMGIAELMRILMDSFGYGWDQAYDIVSHTFAYTNHTVMQEALEKWPVEYIQKLLPRIYMIIQEIDRRKNIEMRNAGLLPAQVNQMAIIRDGMVHMANMAVHVCYSVNGVAKIHTEILKNDLMHDFHQFYPGKFRNKTNGITQRRWLLYSNPQLTELLSETIGDGFKSDINQLDNLMKYVDDPEVQRKFAEVKLERKKILKAYIKRKVGVDVDENSIFDTQAKRLHAYKRQLLNALHIIYLYQRMKDDPSFRIYPRTFIFAAKAAPSYVFAKEVIKLINDIGRKVNNDPDTNQYLKVVFLPNYSVSMAEILLNASDVSEQISTAGKEASGTGNMKYMMNGALTLGTLDGANVEIHELVGSDNDIIFGHTVEELNEMRNYYRANEYYERNPYIRKAVDSLLDCTWNDDPKEYRVIYEELMFKNDEYFVLADFEAYLAAQRKVEEKYRDQTGWRRSMLVNIAKSYYFSSDRTIEDYVNDIWHINKIEL